MTIRTLLLPAIFFTILISPRNLSGQEIFPQSTQDQTALVEADSVALQPFPTIGITDAFVASNRLINAAENKQLTEEDSSSFTSQVDTLLSKTNVFLGDSTTVTLEDMSIRELDHLSQRAQMLMDQIEGLQSRFSRTAGELEAESAQLQDNRNRWQLTQEQGIDDQALESRAVHIETTIQRIDSVINLIQNDLMFLLDEQDKLADMNTRLEEEVSRVKNQKLQFGQTIFKKDVPGFFKDLANLRDTRLVRLHMEEFRGSVRRDFALIKSDYMRDMIKSLLTLLALLSFTIWFKKNHARLISEEHLQLSELNMTIINSPVVSTLFFVALMIRLLIPDLPQIFYAINLVIMLAPMAILMIRIYGEIFRTWIIVLVIATSLNLLYELSYHPGIILRILLLGLCLIGIWLFYWVYRKKPFSELIKHSWVYKLLRVLVVVFLVQQFLSIIANLVGAFALAEFLALFPLQITALAIAIQLTTKLASTILYLVLASKYFQKLNVIKDEFQVIYRKGIWLIDFFLLFLFISIALRLLRVKDLVFDWSMGVLRDGIGIGAVTISLGSILIFVFVIWLSIMISRIVSQILEKDVFNRVKVAKGVPGTVILMLKVVLITGGFFLAAAASGMHLTNLSIVLGAFSVGIGFGLQNIFNNLVSGLILAFERPMSVGDVVQVGELMGTVRHIGLRSSTVRTFDGAEVIVPNGNLISNEVINWTLSDQNRRMDIRVGVDYGADPERVLALMQKIAEEHTEVRKKPAPKAYLIEFGDSSLNFRLLAWVNLDNRFEVESELHLLVHKKLEEDGIKIPYPQRDLHIKSDATRPKPDATKPKPDATKPKPASGRAKK